MILNGFSDKYQIKRSEADTLTIEDDELTIYFFLNDHDYCVHVSYGHA